MSEFLAILAHYSDQIIVGAVGGLFGGAFVEIVRYGQGWLEARGNKGADFHIAATMYTPIDLTNPAHEHFAEAAAAGKTHVQELLWLGHEKALNDFLQNRYVYREVMGAMGRAQKEGLLLGLLPQRAERPLLKKLLGYHNGIPATDLVNIYKDYAGRDAQGRVYGISPPVHEHYPGSPHRRVLRAMFIPDRLLKDGLPPKDKVYFLKPMTHSNRYETVQALINLYRSDPSRFDDCRAYF